MKYLSLFLLIYFFVVGCGSDAKRTSNNKSKNKIEKIIVPQKVDISTKTYEVVPFKNLNHFDVSPKPKDNPFLPEQDDFGLGSMNEDDYVNSQVPVDVKKLSGRDIDIYGFVFPVKLYRGKTVGFVLMSIVPSCCFGDVLRINDLVYVDATNDMQNLDKDQFVRVRGRLDVGMGDSENSEYKFLYWLKADKIDLVKNGL